MNTAWIFVATALCTLAVLAYFAVLTRKSRTGIDGAITLIRSIDVEAFRNLVDPDEEAFLRSTLSPKEFREIKRERAWAAVGYLRYAGKAAVLFARAGQAAQRSSDPEIAASGMQIAHSAVRLRLYTLQAGGRLMVQALLPSTGNRPLVTLIDQYERTAYTLLRLGRLSDANTASRLRSGVA